MRCFNVRGHYVGEFTVLELHRQHMKISQTPGVGVFRSQYEVQHGLR